MTSLSTSGNTLPPQFVLSIPSRSTKKDPFANYILLNATATPDGKAIHLSPAPTQPDTSAPYRLSNTLDYPVILRRTLLNIVSGLPQHATLTLLNGVTVTPPDGGAPLCVLSFRNERILQFLPAGIHRNVPIVNSLPKPTVVTSPAFPVASPPLLTPVATTLAPVGGAGTASQISQILSAPVSPIPLPLSSSLAAPAIPTPAPPKKVVRKTADPLLSPVGGLNPHVAKQLLALARIRKEECPIIAEEFTEGNTAVMPCGHLFSRMGIEESFKKEPRKCPACRALGNPTLV